MSDSPELLKPNTEVTERELQKELSNSETKETFTVPNAEDIESLKEENEDLKRLLSKKSPLALSDFYIELQKLRERNRELRLKIGEERRSSIVQISDLKRQIEGVTDSKLLIELGNLTAENEKLRADYAALLESSTVVTNKLREEVQELRSQLATEKSRWDELREELEDSEETCAKLRGKLADQEEKLAATLAENKKSVSARKDFPDAADVLNQLKTKRKKSSSSLADVELILEMVEEAIAK